MKQLIVNNFLRRLHDGALVSVGIFYIFLLWSDIIKFSAAYIILVVSIGVLLFLLLVLWLKSTGWYYVWYRYTAMWAAKICGIMVRKFRTSTGKIFLLLLIISFLQLVPEVFTNPVQILKSAISFEFLLKTLGIVIMLNMLSRGFKMRKRIVLLQFENFTGTRDLKHSVKGISRRLGNSLNRLTELFQTIDEINPGAKENLICATVGIEDVGKSLKNLIVSDQKIKLASVLEIPIGALAAALGRLLVGPQLGGSLHKKGKRLELIANISGRGVTGNWSVTSDDLDEKEKVAVLSDTEKIVKMTDQLACRIFTDLTKEGSPRWKAVSHFAKGLSNYRQTLRKEKDKYFYLHKAEDAFIAALNEDNKFVQCHYNLGIVYKQLDQPESAEAVFREALKEDHQNANVYFALGIHYYKKEDYDDALWYCEQAIRLNPQDARFWNLRGVVYDTMCEDIYNVKRKNSEEERFPDFNYHFDSFTFAAILSWQKLCGSFFHGEDNPKLKNIARVCMSNLALVHADSGASKSKSLFYQSISVSSGEGKPYFELGRFLFKQEDWKGALFALDKVFEEDNTCADSLTFWTLYVCACGQISEDECDKNRKLLSARYHLLDAISEYLWNLDNIPEEKTRGLANEIEKTVNTVNEAFNYSDDKDEKYKKAKIAFNNTIDRLATALGNFFSFLINKKLEGNEFLSINEKGKLIKKLEEDLQGWFSLELKSEEVKNNDKFCKEEKKLVEKLTADMGILISLVMKHELAKNVNVRDKKKDKSLEKVVEEMMKDMGKTILLLNNTDKKLTGKAKKENKRKEMEEKWALAQIHIFLAKAILAPIENKIGLEKIIFEFFLDKIIEGLKDTVKNLKKNHVREIRTHGLYRFLAWCSLHINCSEDALFYARKAVEFEPESPEARTILIRVYFKLNNYELAQKELENCLILSPCDPTLKYIPNIHLWHKILFRDTEKRRKSFESIIQFFEKTKIQMKPSSPGENDQKNFSNELKSIYLKLGVFHRELKNYDEAIINLKVAAAMNGSYEDCQAKIELGWTYLEAGAYNKAEQTFQDLYNKLYGYKDSNKDDKGIEIYLGLAASIIERTVLVNANNKKDFFNKPQELLKKVGEQLKPDHPWYNAQYHECQGRMAFKQGRIGEAIHYLEQSVSIMASPRVYFFLARTYWMQAQENKSKRYFYLEKAGEACDLSQKCDKNDKYNLEVVELKKRITQAMNRLYAPEPAPPKRKKMAA